jgi:hypothetical protein
MENSEMSQREQKVFQTGLFDDLTVQDMLTIIAIFAAYYDPEDRGETLDRIMEILSSDALFEEKESHTADRINKFTISMKEVEPLNAVKKAAISLTPELRKKAFKHAVQICKTAQEIRTTKILQALASALSIEKGFFDNAVDAIRNDS